MEHKKFQLALVGCGAIAESLYLPVLRKSPGFEHVVIVDPNKARLKEISDRFTTRHHTTGVDDVLDTVAGAIIAAPNNLHFPLAKAFLSRGKPVLIEKPIAETAPLAQAVVELARQNGTMVSVNNLRRLYPSYREVKRLLNTKAFGAPRKITWMEGQAYNWPTVSGFYFRSGNSAAPPRGILLDVGAHVLDVICWWLGDRPEIVSCETDSLGGPEAVAKVVLQSSTCNITVVLNHFYKQSNQFTVSCEGGTIEGLYNEWNWLSWSDDSGKIKKHKLSSEHYLYEDFGVQIVENFLAAIQQHKPLLIDAAEVVSSVTLIDQCYARSQPFNMPWYDRWRSSE